MQVISEPYKAISFWGGGGMGWFSPLLGFSPGIIGSTNPSPPRPGPRRPDSLSEPWRSHSWCCLLGQQRGRASRAWHEKRGVGLQILRKMLLTYTKDNICGGGWRSCEFIRREYVNLYKCNMNFTMYKSIWINVKKLRISIKWSHWSPIKPYKRMCIYIYTNIYLCV